jgi:hypothetical protein
VSSQILSKFIIQSSPFHSALYSGGRRRESFPLPGDDVGSKNLWNLRQLLRNFSQRVPEDCHVYSCHREKLESYLKDKCLIIFHSSVRRSGLLRSPNIFSLVFLVVFVQWGLIVTFVLESWLCPLFYMCRN